MSFQPPVTVLVKPAAALVAYSAYTLSNTSVGDIPTATIAEVNGRPDIIVGASDTFYNATPGKLPSDPFVAGDTFAVQLQGYPLAILRSTGVLTEGVACALDSGGSIAAAAATDDTIIGVTLGATTGAGQPVQCLILRKQNPAFVPA